MKKSFIKKFEEMQSREIFDLNRELKTKNIKSVPFTEEEKNNIKQYMLKAEYMEPNKGDELRISTDTDLTTITKFENGYILLTNCIDAHTCFVGKVTRYIKKK